MKKFTKKPVIIAAIILIAAAGVYFGVSAKKKLAAQNQAGTGYSTAQVSRGDIEVTVEGTGSIIPGDSATVKAKVSGTVESVLMEEGQTVNKGDTILILDGVTGDNEINIQKLNLNIEKAELDDLYKDAQDLKIYAVDSGVVGTINAEEGDELSKNFLLASITDKTQMEMTCSFNKSQVELIEKGMTADVYLPDFWQTVPGKVSKVSVAGIGDGTGAVLYDVEIVLTNPGALNTSMKGLATVNTPKGQVTAINESQLEWCVEDGINVSVAGVLKKLYVTAGDIVKKGQLIAELESPDLDTQIERQKLTVQQQSLKLEEAISDADANVITAPISGTVMSVEVTEGDDLSPSTTIATISDYSALEVTVPVDELDITKVKLGQEAVVTADAISDKEFEAEVVDIAQEGTTSSGVATFDVTLKLIEHEGLMAGMSIDAKIFIESKSDVLLIPIEALQQRGNKNFVMLDGSEGGITEIEIGLATADYVEVTDGLSEGEQILVPVKDSTSNQSQQQNMMPFGGGMPGGAPPSGGQGSRQGGGSGNARN